MNAHVELQELWLSGEATSSCWCWEIDCGSMNFDRTLDIDDEGQSDACQDTLDAVSESLSDIYTVTR
jgi:hypothetical protein